MFVGCRRCGSERHSWTACRVSRWPTVHSRQLKTKIAVRSRSEAHLAVCQTDSTFELVRPHTCTIDAHADPGLKLFQTETSDFPNECPRGSVQLEETVPYEHFKGSQRRRRWLSQDDHMGSAHRPFACSGRLGCL